MISLISEFWWKILNIYPLRLFFGIFPLSEFWNVKITPGVAITAGQCNVADHSSVSGFIDSSRFIFIAENFPSCTVHLSQVTRANDTIQAYAFPHSSTAFVSAFSPVDKPVDDTDMTVRFDRLLVRVITQESFVHHRFSLVRVLEQWVSMSYTTANVARKPRQRFTVGLFGEFACIVHGGGTKISYRVV